MLLNDKLIANSILHAKCEGEKLPIQGFWLIGSFTENFLRKIGCSDNWMFGWEKTFLGEISGSDSWKFS